MADVLQPLAEACIASPASGFDLLTAVAASADASNVDIILIDAEDFKVELLSKPEYYNGNMSLLIDEIISINSRDVNMKIISDYYVGSMMCMNMCSVIINQLASVALFSILNQKIGSCIVK